MAGFRLQARGIRKSFGGVEVLHGVDLDAVGGSILALLGENGAGKSTLVKIIAGDYHPDAGEIDVGGETHTALTPVTARQLGIRMIFQELSDAPALTVAENISLGRWPGRCGVVNWRAIRRRAEEALEQLGVDIDPMQLVSSLRIGERQVVEIARALSDEARCLILDEPTAALSSQEVDRLFTFVQRLRERGVALIYITHRLDEVRQIADRVQVLRDGNVVLVGEVADLDRRQLVSAMVGRAIDDVQRPLAPTWPIGETPVLRFEGASSEGAFADVDLDVRPGEVVALYGKVGSGTGEVADAAFGTLPLTSGTIELDGKPVAFRAGAGDRGRRRAASGRPAAGGRVHGPSRGREPECPVLAPPGEGVRLHHERDRGGRVPPLARHAGDPLAQRSGAADRDALGRQPAEGAARPLARAAESRAAPRRAHARRRRGGAPGDLPLDQGAQRERRRRPHSRPPTTRRSCRSPTVPR